MFSLLYLTQLQFDGAQQFSVIALLSQAVDESFILLVDVQTPGRFARNPVTVPGTCSFSGDGQRTFRGMGQLSGDYPEKLPELLLFLAQLCLPLQV
ncbi:MAG: hypothetical protein II084_06055 [Clostridia bacterium]|nr:hypothetical protein [Clostridia bacterium]